MTTRIKNKIFFETLEDLKEQAIKDYACGEGLEWLDKQESLEEVFKEISLENRIWCLSKGYVQFLKDCDWNELDGHYWASLLCDQPQLVNKCNFDKLNGENWSNLLAYQPQFAEFCDFDKLNGSNLTNLLREQPQLSKYKLTN